MALAPLGRDARPTLLLVDDDDGVRRSLQLLLTGRGYRIKAFSNAAAVMSDPAACDSAVMIADYALRDGDGISLLTALRQRGWSGRAVLVTGHGSPQLERSARTAGFAAILPKPVRVHQLLSSLDAATDKSA